MTIVLGIEMSNPTASPDSPAVVIGRRTDDGVYERLVQRTMPKAARGADGVMAVVDDACAQIGILPADIGGIAVGIGPGGYTALRIATTSAKVLANTLGCVLYAAPSAEVAGVRIRGEQCPAIIALASKGDKAWCTRVRMDGGQRVYETIGVVDASVLESVGVMHLFADSHLPESFVQRCETVGVAVHPIVFDAGDCIEVAMGRGVVEPMELMPMYAREPDAVTQWRDRYGV